MAWTYEIPKAGSWNLKHAVETLNSQSRREAQWSIQKAWEVSMAIKIVKMKRRISFGYNEVGEAEQVL